MSRADGGEHLDFFLFLSCTTQEKEWIFNSLKLGGSLGELDKAPEWIFEGRMAQACCKCRFGQVCGSIFLVNGHQRLWRQRKSRKMPPQDGTRLISRFFTQICWKFQRVLLLPTDFCSYRALEALSSRNSMIYSLKLQREERKLSRDADSSSILTYIGKFKQIFGKIVQFLRFGAVGRTKRLADDTLS